MRSGNAVSFHIGLVPSEALYDKSGGGGGGGLVWPIARRENLISLYSATFVTIFVCNHS